MASSDATPFPVKNQAYRVTFPIFDNDGDLVTGAAGLDSEVSKDGGTFTDCTNEATEIATSSGIYYLDLTATEMNADTVAIKVKSTTTDSKDTPIVLYPQTDGLDRDVNVTHIAGSAVSTTTAQIGVNAVQISGSGTAADNVETAGLNYSATRGLSGTALPAAAADAAGGLPISDAGGLDIDTLLGTLTSLAAETRDATVLDQMKTVIAVIESQRGAHTHQVQGNIFYVDPVNGDTHANGNRGGRLDPYLGVQDCHDNAVTDSNHDLIILVSGNGAGPTTLTENVTLSKRYLFIRGPGRDFIWTRSGAGDTISVTADGIELSGFQLNTAATGSGHGIQVTDADFLRAHNLWINNTQGDGINILRGDNCQIHNVVFTDTGQGGSGQGVHILGTVGASNRNHLMNNVFHQCAGDGVLIENGTTNQTLIHHNVFEGCTGYGVNIGASSTDAFLHDNDYGGNASGEVNDAGTDTIRVDDTNRSTAAALATVDANVDAVLVDTGTTIPGILGTPAGADMSADIAAVKAETATIVSDTNELQTDWADGGRLDLLIDAIKVITDALGATAAARLATSAATMVPGTVDTVTNAHTPTTTVFQADDITEATADHFNGRIVIWTSGALQYQATDITDYAAVGGIAQFTVTAMTEAPANNDTFIII